jgi:[acyl-carrier-protein] S-malonyltransferase
MRNSAYICTHFSNIYQMKTAIVFPGQGSQYPGMGKDLFAASAEARAMFARADEILGFEISKIMFEGTEEQLQATSVTQPAIYLHSVILAHVLGIQGEMTAGHSLGEFSACAFAGALSFEDGLRLVAIRANAMQKACDIEPSTMAAIVGMANEDVDKMCSEIEGIVVPANYNSHGQLVISGSFPAVEKAMEISKTRGAKLAKALKVAGAFHSPFMEPARQELAKGIENAPFNDARIPVYQNATATAETDKNKIRENLIKQLTAPVKWTQSVEQMIKDGCSNFIEVGPGKVLQGLIKRIDSNVQFSGKENLE